MRQRKAPPPWFWLLPASLVVSSAGFVAAGVSSLLAPLPSTAGPARRVFIAQPWPSHEPRSVRAAPILERNPFDSVTGPLTGTPLASVLPAPAPVEPLIAPRCTALDVSVTTEDEDPRLSLAMLQGPDENHGRARRVGDTVAGFEVAYIGYNRLEQSPAVWLTGPQGLCQALLFDETAEVKPRERAKPSAAPKAKKDSKRKGTPLPDAIKKGIEQLGPGTFRIARSSVDAIIGSFTSLTRSVRIRPETQSGSVVGFKLSRVPKNTLLDELGFEKGDLLQSINGIKLSGPTAALAAYARLSIVDEIRVKGTRNGNPLFLEYRID